MPENLTDNDKRLWEHKIGDYINQKGTERESTKPVHCTHLSM